MEHELWQVRILLQVLEEGSHGCFRTVQGTYTCVYGVVDPFCERREDLIQYRVAEGVLGAEVVGRGAQVDEPILRDRPHVGSSETAAIMAARVSVEAAHSVPELCGTRDLRMKVIRSFDKFGLGCLQDQWRAVVSAGSSRGGGTCEALGGSTAFQNDGAITMTRVPSNMAPLGMEAPPFSLVDVRTGHLVSRDDFRDRKGLLVMFICNHCPFVKLLNHALAEFGREYEERGLDIVAISSNDPVSHPDDGPAEMKDEAEKVGYTFPYCFDATQEVAKAYQAACTPDFFLFDGALLLAYRGQFDASRPGNGIDPTGEDMRAAADAVLAGRELMSDQTPSVGCNIKWKPGN